MDSLYGAGYGLAAPPECVRWADDEGGFPEDVWATFAALDLDSASVESFLAIRRRIASLKADLARIRADLS